AVHWRQDYTDAPKHMWWKRPDGTSGLGGRPARSLPLYGTEHLPDLPADTTIVVSEGEKATDAFNALGLAGVRAVGTVTGAPAVPDAASFEPLLKFPTLSLWPDADDAGERQMASVAAILAKRGHRDVRRLSDPGADPGSKDDAADFVARRGDGAALRQLLDAAEPWAAPAAETRRPRQSVVRQLLELAQPLELFRDPTGSPYASVKVGGRRETWRLPGPNCDDYLRKAYWEVHQGAPAEAPLKQVGATLAAQARYGDAVHQVFLRNAWVDGVLYVDLGDDSGRAVRIRPLGSGQPGSGFDIVADPPVYFRRGSTALPLPEPVFEGELRDGLERIWRFCNVPDGTARVLALAWLVAAGFPRGPHAALVLGGPQDAGKSTTQRVLRDLYDPDSVPGLSPPRDEEDLQVLAGDTAVLCLENVPYIDAALSDWLCRLLDGSGLKHRARYTDTGVATLAGCLPVMVNGIGDLVTRGDLASRSVHLRLSPLSWQRRLAPEEFERSFREAHPHLFGAICALKARVLGVLPSVQLQEAPRIVLLAKVAVACEQVLGWEEGTALAALSANADQGAEQALGESPIVGLLEQVLEEHGGSWEAEPAKWYEAINAKAGEKLRESRRYPKSASAFGRQLDLITGPLQRRGIAVERPPRGTRRAVFLYREGIENVSRDLASSPVGAAPATSSPEPGLGDLISGPGDGSADGSADGRRADDRNALAAPTGDDGSRRELGGPPVVTEPPIGAEFELSGTPGRAAPTGNDGSLSLTLNEEEKRRDSDSAAPPPPDDEVAL
ncbi:MAG: hypothetical protein ACRDXC_02535, partial [Acidimicrobiales bacterium]